MPASIGFIICFILGVWSGMAWIRASRLDKADKLVQTIIKLRAELARERQKTLADWLFEDETP